MKCKLSELIEHKVDLLNTRQGNAVSGNEELESHSVHLPDVYLSTIQRSGETQCKHKKDHCILDIIDTKLYPPNSTKTIIQHAVPKIYALFNL